MVRNISQQTGGQGSQFPLARRDFPRSFRKLQGTDAILLFRRNISRPSLARGRGGVLADGSA